MRPLVSVIVLNYNGARFLEECLSSLAGLEYPRERLDVIVVDNGSADDSLALVRERFPWMRVMENGANLGFSRGNNVGIRQARGDYVVVLNNDTRVDRDWLGPLVETASRDARVGMCTSKIRLRRRRLELVVSCEPFTPRSLGGNDDPRSLGVCVRAATLAGGHEPIEFLGGFYPWELRGGEPCRWSGARARLGIPIEREGEGLDVVLTLAPERPIEAGPANLRIAGGPGEAVLFRQDASNGVLPAECRVRLDAALVATARPVVQNAGSVVFSNGASRDRGAAVVGTTQYYETDHGQYDDQEEVFAACGASMLMKRAMLEDVGLFDESFFLYYEDTDLSWRARLRGWRIVYVPGSVVWHVHCGTSGEWSPLFVYHTERNRLAMLAKNGTAGQAVKAWGGSVTTLARSAMGALLYRLKLRRDPGAGRVRLRCAALASLLWALPYLCVERMRIQRSRRVSREEIGRWVRQP